MTWPIQFNYRIRYQGPNQRHPIIVARLHSNGDARRFEFHVDTGAEYTLMDGDSLRPLGFDPPTDEDVIEADARDLLEDIECKRFGPLSGGKIFGFRFNVTLCVVGGPQDIEMAVYGSLMFQMTRNLLGRDFIRKISVLGVDDYNTSLYFARV